MQAHQAGHTFQGTEGNRATQQVVDQSSMGIGEGGQASKLCREKGRGVVDPPLQLPASSCALTVGRETVLSADV